jgi:DNA primase
MQVDDLGFPDAVRKLSERGNIPITETGGKAGVAKGYKVRLGEVCKEAAAFYHTQLMRSTDANAQGARSYLAARGFGGDVPKKWQLGFAPGNDLLVKHLRKLGFKDQEIIDANVAVSSRGRLKDRFYNRIMFPIGDIQGAAIAFGGRILGDGEPKYLNSQETPIFHKSEVLFGLDKAKATLASTGVAVVVEGYTDTIALHEAGITNVVATLGTALTAQHIRILARHAKNKIVYLFDGDEAGQRAADRALGFIDDSITPEKGRLKIRLAAATLPEKLDPADFVAEKGADALRALIDDAQDLIEYGIERRLARWDLNDAESRSRAVADAISILAPIKDSLLAKDYAVKIAGKVPRMKEEGALALLAQLKVPRSFDGASSPANVGTGTASGTGAGAGNMRAEAGVKPLRLPQAELNRRRFEREFLSLCAHHPELGLTHSQTLAQTQWHEAIHAHLAERILEVLSRDAQISAAELVSAVAAEIPKAASILTSGAMGEKTDFATLARFLIEELEIGDAEDTVAALKVQLNDTKNLSAEEQELLFGSVVAMQKDITRRRQEHIGIEYSVEHA